MVVSIIDFLLFQLIRVVESDRFLIEGAVPNIALILATSVYKNLVFLYKSPTEPGFSRWL